MLPTSPRLRASFTAFVLVEPLSAIAVVAAILRSAVAVGFAGFHGLG